MTQLIEQSFVKQYETDVHLAYQRMGSKFRNCVRTKTGIVGSSTTFQKAGRGAAQKGKPRHGRVTPMNADRSSVECTLDDYYAGEWCDLLDLNKVKHDERQVIVNTGAYALGRKTDDAIVAEMAASAGTNIANYDTGMSRKVALDLLEAFNSRDIPDDGNRWCALSSHAWGELLRVDEFSRSEFVGAESLPFKTPMTVKKWLTINWFEYSDLPLANSDDRDNLAWHSSAVGHAIGEDVKADITWNGPEVAWFINQFMSMGAKVIDSTGVFKLRLDDDTAYS